MKMLVTGGAGCIGSELAARLHERGDEVTVIDNLSSGRREHIEGLFGRKGFRFLGGDLLDGDALARAFGGVEGGGIEMVWHLAANPDIRYTMGGPTGRDLEQNTIVTHAVLDAMRVRGVRRLAFASSSAVYGVSTRQPIPEDQAARPVSLYGAAKLACEGLVSAFANLFEMDAWIFRFANIVGGKVRAKGKTVIGDFIDKLERDPRELEILGDGRQAKSYLACAECVDAMLFAVGRGGAGARTFNLGCADSLSVRRIAEIVAESMGLEGTRFRYTGGEVGWPGDVPRFVLDVAAMEGMGWRARRGSEDAVRMAVEATLAGRGLKQRKEEPVCRQS